MNICFDESLGNQDRERLEKIAEHALDKMNYNLPPRKGTIMVRNPDFKDEDICLALKLFSESGPDLVVPVDPQGEELNAFFILSEQYTSSFGIDPDASRKNAFPMILPSLLESFSLERHSAEAKEYLDRIGDRLDNPDIVDSDKKHLIEDDLQRMDIFRSFPPKGRVLDIGCSDGSVIIKILEKFAENIDSLLAIDLVDELVKKANSKKDKLPDTLKGKVSFEAKRVEDLEFNNFFDTVYAGEVLEHVGPYMVEPTLKKIKKMCSEGAYVYISVPNRYPSPGYVDRGKSRWKWPTHYHFFSELSLKYEVSKFFSEVEFYAHYPNDSVDSGIYLICKARALKD